MDHPTFFDSEDQWFHRSQNDCESRKLRRNTDPSTSHKAAAETEPHLNELQQLVLARVKEHPGYTANEICNGLRNAESLRKRFHELKNLGLIEVCGERRCRVTGKTARTWSAVVPLSRTRQEQVEFLF